MHNGGVGGEEFPSGFPKDRIQLDQRHHLYATSSSRFTSSVLCRDPLKRVEKYGDSGYSITNFHTTALRMETARFQDFRPRVQ
jgi:hypothetical protein